MGNAEDFSDEAFDEIFGQVDTDGSGQVEKEEMCTFFKKLMGSLVKHKKKKDGFRSGSNSTNRTLPDLENSQV